MNNFKQGIRMIMLILRGKDGGKNDGGDRVSKRKISRNEDEFNEILSEFESIKKPLERIYSCVNERDMSKAIREFKRRQLDADYDPTGMRDFFYIDISNRFLSCLMSPNCRAETKFLIDIDSVENEEIVKRKISELKIKIIFEYKTKDGIHIITEPFNPSLVPEADIKKDGLMLLRY